MYIRLSDLFYPISDGQIRADNKNTSYPQPMPVDVPGYASVVETDKPAVDTRTQKCIESAPLPIGDQWIQQWTISPLSTDELTDLEERRISNLWYAAHNTEYAAISGSAVGLLVLGVLQGKPKCIAVQAWIKSIWTEYYIRKFSTSTDTDFTIVGNCPHSVPELMTEVTP